MPTYTFRNKLTNEEITEVMTIAERDQLLKENPDIEQLIVKAPLYGDPIQLGRVKPSAGFRQLLQKIKKANKGSNINTF